MSVLTLDQPVSSANDVAQRMRTSMAAARVSFTWFGTQKTLTTQQKAEAAGAFGAEGAFLSAGKKLLDTRCPEIRAVSAVRNRVVSFWRGVSLPFPEAGIRLIGQERIEFFDQQMGAFQSQLETAVEKLDRQFDVRLRDAASHRLGRLYDRSDYPDSLIGLFAVSWDFPSVEPPDYLRELHPRLYSQDRCVWRHVSMRPSNWRNRPLSKSSPISSRIWPSVCKATSRENPRSFEIRQSITCTPSSNVFDRSTCAPAKNLTAW